MRKSGDWNLNLAAAKKDKTGGTLQQTVLVELWLRLRSAYKTDADPRRDAAQKTNGGLTGRRSKRRILGVYVRNYVNPKDPTHSRDTTYNILQPRGPKNWLNVETHLKHISELLLSGFGGELSKPTLTWITDLARKAREGIDQLSVFSNSGNKQR